VANNRIRVQLVNGGVEARDQFRERLAAESTARIKNGATFR
jgi:hypothetical protein